VNKGGRESLNLAGSGEEEFGGRRRSPRKPPSTRVEDGVVEKQRKSLRKSNSSSPRGGRRKRVPSASVTPAKRRPNVSLVARKIGGKGKKYGFIVLINFHSSFLVQD
jgi:hypothetical protein